MSILFLKLSNGVLMPLIRPHTVCSYLSVKGTAHNGSSLLSRMITCTYATDRYCQTSLPRCNTKITRSDSTASNENKLSAQRTIGFLVKRHSRGGCRLNVYPGEPDKSSERDTFSLQPAPPRTFVAKVGGNRQVCASTHNR